MILILLFIALVAVLYTLEKERNPRTTVRESILVSWVIISFLLWSSTELFSLFNAINRGAIVIWTSSLLLIAGLALWYLIKAHRLQTAWNFTIDRRYLWICLGLIVAIIVPLFAVTLLYPPNNWDSMTYHLPRIEHWIQNGNIGVYPTNNARQNLYPPFAHYITLQLRLLNNSDLMSNHVQFISMLMTQIALSLIVQKLGLPKKWQLLVVIFGISLPTGILESVTTQNDYTASAYSLIAIYFAWKLRTGLQWRSIALITGALGLALLTKPHTGLLFLPLAIWIGVVLIRKYKLKGVATIVLISMGALTINLPFYARIYQETDDFLASTSNLTNETHSLPFAASNIIRNLSLGLGTPDKDINNKIEEIITNIHERFLGIPAAPAENTFAYGGEEHPFKAVFGMNEDTTGNFAHTLLFLLASIWALTSLFSKNIPKKRLFLLFLLVTWGGLLLYSGVFRWQIWGNRLLLPWFQIVNIAIILMLYQISHSHQKRALIMSGYALIILLANIAMLLLGGQFLSTSLASLFSLLSTVGYLILVPCALLLLGRIPARYHSVAYGLLVMIPIGVFIIFSTARPLRPSFIANSTKDQRIYARAMLNKHLGIGPPQRIALHETAIESMQKISTYIRKNNVQTVALEIGGDTWEYPLWYMIVQRNDALRMYHVNARMATQIFRRNRQPLETRFQAMILEGESLALNPAIISQIYTINSLYYGLRPWYFVVFNQAVSITELYKQKAPLSELPSAELP